MNRFVISCALLLAGCGGNGDDGFPSRPDVTPPVAEWQIPEAHLLDIDGQALAGSSLEGSYFFVDPNTPARPEGNSEPVWRESQGGVLGQGYVLDLTSDMVGKRLAFCVTPVAQGVSQTRGEERCSLPMIVTQPTGYAPEALAVALSNAGGLTVGDTVTGLYTYQDADPQDREGSSRYSWLADGVAIAGANTPSLILTAAQQGKQIIFCVRPASVPRDPYNNPTLGQRRCSDASAAVAAKVGQAPEVARINILGSSAIGSTLYGSYLFADPDGDKEGNSIRLWKRDNVAIAGQNSRSYQLVESDLGAMIGYCVTPVAQTGLPDTGNERCTITGPVVANPSGVAPTATPVINISNGGWPEAGAVLRGSYQYFPSVTARPEGNSVSFWRVENRDQLCSGQPCDYTISNDDIGLAIQYCVVPVDNAGLSGSLSCTQMTGAAITLHGYFEYNRNLYARIVGLSGTSRWLVDTSNTQGPEHNDNMADPLGSFHIPAYRIGTSLYAALRGQLGFTSDAVTDLNGNGMLDNREWADGIRNGTAPTIDARHFVGKEVKFCLQTTEYGEICLNASESRGAGDTLCQDASQCVVGGVYYNASNALKRGISPVTRLLLAGNDSYGNPIDGSAYFHRPLSKAEATLKAQAGFGGSLPDPEASGTLTQGGINWGLFSHAAPAPISTSHALQLCRNLTNGDPVGSWSLPVESDAYPTDNHAAPNGDNQAPTTAGLNLLSLWQLRFGGQVTPVNELDPLFGWPKKEVWSATLGTTGTHKAVSWQLGNNVANWRDSSALLVSCIQ
ncbi:hypothetical protein ACK323_01020 [Aeromonas enteropelogenes]|uniref:hypothetical protein n=1 Tax=Aeromonas enteropelogenes TaxID=29489 RepID=UPI00398A1FCE